MAVNAFDRADVLDAMGVIESGHHHAQNHGLALSGIQETNADYLGRPDRMQIPMTSLAEVAIPCISKRYGICLAADCSHLQAAHHELGIVRREP